jgi:hypothetical protein
MKIMKISKPLLLSATVIAVAMGQNLQATNLASAAALASASVHRSIVASPHGLEEFPWLLREASARAETKASSVSVLSTIKQNRALAASPRMREQFPELARGGWSSTDVSSKPATAFTPPEQVIKNRALAASPRMKEQYPALARGYTPQPAEKPLQVAPLK